MGKLFIFDMGEVLILNVKKLQAIAKRFGFDYKPFRAFYGIYDKDLMEGKMDSMEFLRIVEKEYNVKVDENLFITDFHPIPNHFIMNVIDELRKNGHRCVLGSNTFAPHISVVSNLEDKPLSHLDHLYLSHEMGIAKPDVEFFKYILREESVKPENAVFVDDRIDNINAASSIGIKTLLYSDNNREEAEEFFKAYIQ